MDVIDGPPHRPQEKNFPVYAAATLLALIFGAIAVGWVHHDTRPQQMDPATHLRRSLAYANAIRDASPRQLYGLWRAEYGMYTYPPLTHLTIGFVIAAGASPDVAAAIVNSAFAWLLLVSVIQIGRAAFNLATGVIAAALCLSFMTLAFLQRTAFPDFALTAMVAWSCWRLLLTDVFSRRRASVIFGLAVGAAMLVKQMALPFAAIAAAGLIVANFRRMNRFAWLNALLAGVIAAAVSLSWYGFHFRTVSQIGRFNQYVVPAREEDPTPWTWEGSTYYLQQIATQLGPPLLILAGAAALVWVVMSFAKNQRQPPQEPISRQARLLIASWLIGGLLLLTYVVLNKDYRYHAPTLPALALLIASLFAWPATRAGRTAVLFVLLLAGAPYFYLSTIGTPHPALPRLLRTQWNMPPVREDWRIEQLIEDVAEVAPKLNKSVPPRLGIAPHCESYGHPSLRLEFERRHVNVRLEGFEDKDPTAATEMDLVLTKTGEQGQEMLERDPELINRFVADHPDTFSTVASYSLPDGSTATLYRVTKRTSVLSTAR
jgi:hypothetical protein